MDVAGRTKKELAELIKAYQQALDFNIICSSTDLKGNIIYVNKKFCEISKYSYEELIGHNHRILNSGHHSRDFFKQMWKTIGKGEAWHGEVKNKAKDGSYYWVDTVVLPVRDENDRIFQYVSLRLPITERKMAEEEQNEYIDNLKDLLYITSHKVSKPVTSCLGLMHLIDEKQLDQENLKKVITHFRENAMELDAVTRELTQKVYEMERKMGTQKKPD